MFENIARALERGQQKKLLTLCQQALDEGFGPGDILSKGMIIGMNARSDDMVVNPCKAKKATNMRAAGSDDNIKLAPARTFTLEEALEFIDDDELNFRNYCR